jgi:uncharacterized protein YndB with AHSA1/START domain
MERDIVMSWYFEQTPVQVWDCLTNPEILNQWFMKNDFKAVVGHQFTFIDKPKVAFGWDGIVYSEVLEVIPQQKLVYTWRAGCEPGVVTMGTLLIWTLKPKKDGTLLQLEHRRSKGLKNYMSSLMIEKGWRVIINKKFQKVLTTYTT